MDRSLFTGRIPLPSLHTSLSPPHITKTYLISSQRTRLPHLPPLRRAGRTLLICVASFGVAMIAFALSRSFLLSLLLLAASGAVDNVSVVLRSTLLQMVTPAHMLGRVSSVNQVFIGSSNEIGAFESGLAARFMGLVPSVVFGGCMTLLVVAFTSWKVPELRKMDRIA